MEVIGKEAFAFTLLNDLSDNYNLHPEDCKRLSDQIWAANDHKKIDGIIKFLQNALLLLMRPQ